MNAGFWCHSYIIEGGIFADIPYPQNRNAKYVKEGGYEMYQL